MPTLKALLNIITLGVLDFSPGADSNVKATALKTHKSCTKCKAVKPLDGFGKRKTSSDGRKPQCKVCISAYNEKRYAKPSVKAAAKAAAKAASKARYATPEGKAAAKARYAKPEVKAAAKAASKARYATPEGKAAAKAAAKARYAKPEVKAAAKASKAKRKADPVLHAADLKQMREHYAKKSATPEGLVEVRCSARITKAKRDFGFTWGLLGEDLPRGPYKGPDSTFNLLGIVSWTLYAKYINDRFYGGMVWPVFQIDHIKPLCSFNLSDPEERTKAFHYTNTRPLFKEDNKAKIAQDMKWKEEEHPLHWDCDKWVIKQNWELIDENDKYGLNKYHTVAPAAKRRRLV